MTATERQKALQRHGLEEEPEGLSLTWQGFQKAAKRALALRDAGDEEAARMIALRPDHPLRWEYARCIQIEAFTNEAGDSGF